MSKEKQIEEMWNIITTDCDRECVGCEFENDEWCFTHSVVNKLYNAGYRKQSEGEWIEIKTYNEYLMSYDCAMACSCCNHVLAYGALVHKTKFCPNCGAKMKGGTE